MIMYSALVPNSSAFEEVISSQIYHRKSFFNFSLTYSVMSHSCVGLTKRALLFLKLCLWGGIALFVYANERDDLLGPNLAEKWQSVLWGERL